MTLLRPQSCIGDELLKNLSGSILKRDRGSRMAVNPLINRATVLSHTYTHSKSDSKSNQLVPTTGVQPLRGYTLKPVNHCVGARPRRHPTPDVLRDAVQGLYSTDPSVHSTHGSNAGTLFPVSYQHRLQHGYHLATWSCVYPLPRSGLGSTVTKTVDGF